MPPTEFCSVRLKIGEEVAGASRHFSEILSGTSKPAGSGENKKGPTVALETVLEAKWDLERRKGDMANHRRAHGC
jgi:hypothetical protein